MAVTIKMEKEIDTCLDCPFKSEYVMGHSYGMCGEYIELRCSKLGRKIKDYDKEDVLNDEFTVEIPDDCPFNAP